MVRTNATHRIDARRAETSPKNLLLARIDQATRGESNRWLGDIPSLSQ